MSDPMAELNARLDAFFEKWGISPDDEPEPVTRWMFTFRRTWKKSPWTCGQCHALVDQEHLEGHCRWHITNETISNAPRIPSGGSDDYCRTLRFVLSADDKIVLTR